jgi:hypothetical protein
MIDRETVEWRIKTLRNAIGHDWAVLATEGLSSNGNRTLFDHLAGAGDPGPADLDV